MADGRGVDVNSTVGESVGVATGVSVPVGMLNTATWGLGNGVGGGLTGSISPRR